jgi:uncharacterized protein YhbP (UPF0306 family)
LDNSIAELLELSTMTLATASSDGHPHAAPVYFVALQEPAQERHEGDPAPLLFYFFSEPYSQHSRDIELSGTAAGAIYPETPDWREIRGLQLVGKARLVSRGAEWEAAWKGYRHKFPFVAALKLIVARNALYVLTPTWMRLVDNRRGFGFKQEWSFSE